MSTEKRPYRMKQRAAALDATRRRITESAVELHSRLGPSRTTMAAVADHAGVRRSTLYRHFPDEEALFEACSSHWYAQYPPPLVERWSEVVDPQERLVVALTELYGWYRAAGGMIELLIRDETIVPSVGRRFRGFRERLVAARDVLLADRSLSGRTKTRVAALVDVGLQFETWRALCRDGGLDEREAAELLSRLVAAES